MASFGAVFVPAGALQFIMLLQFKMPPCCNIAVAITTMEPDRFLLPTSLPSCQATIDAWVIVQCTLSHDRRVTIGCCHRLSHCIVCVCLVRCAQGFAQLQAAHDETHDSEADVSSQKLNNIPSCPDAALPLE